MKFYAVAVGKKVGIYGTWKLCKEQVHGFSGAKYKSFSSSQEAREWIENNRIATNKAPTFEKTCMDTIPSLEDHPRMNNLKMDTLEIYTDGSISNNSSLEGNPKMDNRLQYGAFFTYGQKEYLLSGGFFKAELEALEIPFCATMNSPTAELLGVLMALRSLRSSLFLKQKIKKIIFHVDYIGIIRWLDHSWKAKTPHTKKLVDFIRSEIKAFATCKIEIQFLKVKAHSGVYGNEKADSLASEGKKLDMFQEF